MKTIDIIKAMAEGFNAGVVSSRPHIVVENIRVSGIHDNYGFRHVVLPFTNFETIIIKTKSVKRNVMIKCVSEELVRLARTGELINRVVKTTS